MLDPTEENHPLAELAEGLRRILPMLAGGPGQVRGLERVSAGATQEVWRFEAVVAGGAQVLILRRAPGGAVRDVGETGGLRLEARLMTAAAERGVPVPCVRHVLTPEDGLGEGFIMDFVPGETLGGRIVRSAALAEARSGLAFRCGEVLARIHSLDLAPFPELQAYSPGDLVAQWEERYRRSDWPRPVFELALRWLGARRPSAPAVPRLVHGDFRNGNLMIGSEGLGAVLDWELAHLGDPMEDLGWICVNSWRFGREILPVGGFGTREELYAGYEAAGGWVDRPAALWWEVFGTLRWGCMCAGMTEAFRTHDPGVERAVICRRTSETEIDLLRLLLPEAA